MNTDTPRRKTRTALAVCVVGGAYLLWTFVSKYSLPMEVHGKRYLGAFLACDGGTLYAYTYKEEIRANGYTPAKMTEVCRAIVSPAIRDFTRGRGYDISVDDQPSVIAKLQAMDSENNVIRWGVQLYKTPDGVKGEFLRTAFYAPRCADAAREKASPMDRRGLARTSDALYMKHSEMLERLGITVLPTMALDTATLKSTDLAYNARRYRAIVASGMHGVSAKSWGPWSDPDYWGPAASD